jgi:putative sterol carrier protein
MALNNDRAYREVGKAWTFGAVAMIVRSDPANGVERAAGIILDVHAGECRSARFVEGTDDPADAEFVIVGSYARWKDVIEGKLDPIKGMMEGKLKLTRGHLPTICRRSFASSNRHDWWCRAPAKCQRISTSELTL